MANDKLVGWLRQSLGKKGTTKEGGLSPALKRPFLLYCIVIEAEVLLPAESKTLRVTAPTAVPAGTVTFMGEPFQTPVSFAPLHNLSTELHAFVGSVEVVV